MSELLSLPRLARRLGLTQKWLRDQAESGEIPCLRAGSRFLFDYEAVETALAKRAAKSREGPVAPAGHNPLTIGSNKCHACC